MKKLLLLCLLLLGGCSTGVHTSLVEMDMDVDLPFLTGGSRQAVVFPDRAAADGGSPMVEAFGPEWRSVERAYPEYRFNP